MISDNQIKGRSSMATGGSTSYMECLLRIDTSIGWELSVTKVLASFEDLSYEINPSLGFIYVKGKADPHIILKKLKRGGKHATIQRISYGFPSDDQYYQFQDPHESGHNNYLLSRDPFYRARYPYYETGYNQFNHPYSSWYNNMPQSALPYGNHQVLEHEYQQGIRSCSGCSYDSHCPMHSKHHPSPVSSQSGNTIVQNSSSPSIRAETNDQANNQSTSEQSSRISIKKIIEKLGLSCLSCKK